MKKYIEYSMDVEEEFYPGRPNYRTRVVKSKRDSSKLSDKEKAQEGLTDRRPL